MKAGLAIVAALASAVSLAASAVSPKYVFLFIGDGMSVPQRMTAEEFSRKAGNGPLAMNQMPFQAMTRTCSANSLVTDSAAAATAIACGSKTRNGSVGVDADGNPIESCAEAARAAGRKVGIMTTVTITHATPAGFYAHRKQRGESYGIALDLADSGFDFFAGGGLDYNYADKKSPDYGRCGNAYEYAESKGYRIVRHRAEFLALKPSDGKVLTRFTDGALDNTIDIAKDADQPTLSEMVSKAVEMLDGPDGFFIMAEGGRIDWSGHANDAATNLREVLALDDAVKVAFAFQERHPDETLVVVTGDHETGGMSMGFAGTGHSLFIERLASQTMSVGAFDNAVGRLYGKRTDVSFDEVKPLIEKAFGFKFGKGAEGDPMALTAAELKDIKAAFDHDAEFHKAKIEENRAYDGERRYQLGGACRIVISHKAGIGWSSGSHTSLPALTTAKGCGAELFTGFIENYDISRKIKSFYGK